jgi:hypothetical protein
MGALVDSTEVEKDVIADTRKRKPDLELKIKPKNDKDTGMR